MTNLRARLLAVLLVVSGNLQAQLKFFSAANDTGAFFKNAHSVKRYEQNQFVVTDLDKAVYKTNTVITVLDQQADDELLFVETTDKYRQLEEAEIIIYNEIGLPVKTYTKKDLKKQASGEGLIDDGYYYYLRLRADKYPMTFEFRSTIRYKGIVNYPSFILQSPGQAVIHSSCSVVVPTDLGLRYLNQATCIAPVKTPKEDGTTTYTWQTDSLPAIEKEDGTLHWYSCYPRITIAPNKFKLDNFPGDFDSWDSFGRWYGGLGSKARDLAEYDKATIRAKVANASSDKEKIKILYEYLQENFRYVSIQLGIGGFRPFPASFTQANKYGDCKALSNYMQACLEAVNIRSYQALVNAGANGASADPSFPVDVFNHVILCVPQEKDSIWLECTSKETDFGVLSNFTENRNALLITENGGVLVPTPKSNAKENRLGIKAVVKIQEDGSGEVHSDILATGEYKLQLVYRLYNESADDQKAAIISQLEMPVPERFELHLPPHKKTAELVTGIDAAFEKVAAFSAGDKMFLHTQWHPVKTPVLPLKDERTQDFYFSNPFEKQDTTVYELPKGYIIESLPKPADISNKYGVYHSRTEYNAATGQVISIASLTLNDHKIPAADFLLIKRFFSEVIKDKTQKIIVKKE